MVLHTHRTIQALYQAARLTKVITLTADQFGNTEELKNLQLYDFDGMVFFVACNQLWEMDEETGKFHVIHPIKTPTGGRITYVTGNVAA